MNSLYKFPIHGVICGNISPQKNALFKENINLFFRSVHLKKSLSPCWVLADKGERYTTKVSLYIDDSKDGNEEKDYYLNVQCQGQGTFKLSNNNISIDWQEEGTSSSHYFQNIAIALWLELKSVLCIHANGLAFNEQAIALVAPSRTGKTTLTAALCQHGFEMMTDDMLALHKEDNGYHIYPSWPIARLWPDALGALEQSKILTTGIALHKKVHQKFEKKVIDITTQQHLPFCTLPKELSTVYFLNRVEGKAHSQSVEIVTIPAAQAVILLLQNSILADAFKSLGIEEDRVERLASVVKTLTFKRITYSTGLERLNDVCLAIKQDLEKE